MIAGVRSDDERFRSLAFRGSKPGRRTGFPAAPGAVA